MPTVQDWLRQHNLLNLSGRDQASPLTVGEEQAVVDPALRALRPGYTGGDMNTAGKYQMILQYLTQMLPESFNTPIPRADVVRAGNEWGYIGAIPGDDPGPAHGLRIPGVGPGMDGRYLESLLAQRRGGQVMPQPMPQPMPRSNPSALVNVRSDGQPGRQTASAPQAPLAPPQPAQPASAPMQAAISQLARRARPSRPQRSGIQFF